MADVAYDSLLAEVSSKQKHKFFAQQKATTQKKIKNKAENRFRCLRKHIYNINNFYALIKISRNCAEQKKDKQNG
jgi:hypothetical protein